ncbi:hypothetical protein VVD49_13450 [Uliginosibacterium sp. H3]|uniref:Uncharacterized protein n=1 Tax=Uliginosibacterium silvisoli TaxID=3114758 RepID=A0ABU6K532_9RHOO|nr:hypothetical protein [Uliginosibacterium sp. H3]
MRRKIVTALVAFFFVCGIAQAFIPVVAVATWMLNVSGGSILVWDALFATTGVVTGLLWADCTYQVTSCKDASVMKTSAQTVQSPNLRAKINLTPSAARGNPNPKRWDTSGKDVSPKSSFPVSDRYPTMASSWPAVVQDIGGSGVKKYANGTAGYRQVTVSTVKETSMGTVAFQGTVVVGSQPAALYYVWDKPVSEPADCSSSPGYSLVGVNCVLTTPADVKKPADVPCEVLLGSSGFETDPVNPNCDNSQVKTTGDLKTVTLESVDGSKTEVRKSTGGGLQILTTSPDNSWNTVETAPYDAGQGGFPIVSSSKGTGTPPVSAGTTPSPGTGSSGGSSSAGSSPGSGSGGGTNGLGDCGSSSTPCAVRVVNEDGVSSPSWDGVQSASLADQYQSRVDAQRSDDHGISWSGFFPDLWFGADPVPCVPMNLNMGAFAFNFDFCNNQFLIMMKKIAEWLMYVGTVFYIWRRFLSAEVEGVANVR